MYILSLLFHIGMGWLSGPITAMPGQGFFCLALNCISVRKLQWQISYGSFFFPSLDVLNNEYYETYLM